MKLFVFSILDTKTGIFNTPFFMAHPGQAVRAVTDLAQDQSTTIGRHPSDYALVQVGSWDDNSGAFENHPPVNLGQISGFLPVQRPSMPLFEHQPDDLVIPPKPNGHANA